MTLVSTSRRPARLNCWKIMAQRARQWRSSRPCKAVTSVSLNRMRPALASPRRLIVRSRVDLPDPDWPITPSIWPPGTASDTSSTARLSPKLLTTFCNCSTPAPRVAFPGSGAGLHDGDDLVTEMRLLPYIPGEAVENRDGHRSLTGRVRRPPGRVTG